MLICHLQSYIFHMHLFLSVWLTLAGPGRTAPEDLGPAEEAADCDPG